MVWAVQARRQIDSAVGGQAPGFDGRRDEGGRLSRTRTPAAGLLHRRPPEIKAGHLTRTRTRERAPRPAPSRSGLAALTYRGGVIRNTLPTTKDATWSIHVAALPVAMRKSPPMATKKSPPLA